jgi:hypothetical protein
MGKAGIRNRLHMMMDRSLFNDPLSIAVVK